LNARLYSLKKNKVDSTTLEKANKQINTFILTKMYFYQKLLDARWYFLNKNKANFTKK